MKLSTRLAAAMVALAVLTATAVGFISYYLVESAILSSQIERQKSNIDLVTLDVEARMRGARNDILSSLSSNALAGMLRASLNNGFDPVGAVPFGEWKRRFERRLVGELAAKRNYLQFRVIGAAGSGREIVRVERTADGTIRAVPDDELQDKGDRDYVRKTIALAPGSVYITPIELNQERGVIETPHVPVMRVAAPIHANDGKVFGVLIINLDLRPAFARIRESTQPGSRIFLVNENGDFLIHPDRQREFGFDFGQRFNWKDEMPRLAAALGPAPRGVRVVRDQADEKIVGAVASVRLAGGPLVSLIETAPYDQVMAAAISIRRATLLVVLAGLVLAALLAALIARSLTRPLVTMTRAVEDFAADEPLRLPHNAGGEIGTLARTFERMAADVRQKTFDLKTEIEERKRIFEASIDIVMVTDRWGNILRINPSSERILGYRPDEMIGDNASKYLFAMDLNQTRAEMRAAVKDGGTSSFNARYVHKSGRVVPLSWTGIWSEAAHQHFFVGRDMTDHAALEQQPRPFAQRAV